MKIIKLLVIGALLFFAYKYYQDNMRGIQEMQGKWVLDRNATLREYRRSGLPEEIYQKIREVVKAGASVEVDGTNVRAEAFGEVVEYTYKQLSKSANCYSLEYEPAPVPGLEKGEVCFESGKLYVSTPFKARDIYVRP